ncbi:hypothetical protein CC117_17855 [Parafrankia colletiae]|uniref:Glycosyltransferase 2-like domain-containing protein n=1 Tax=Parafrankia colletiae TaxID=573497 RepID=A0A1S1QSK0_9ACTN|nr:glycosyltransferase family 2 protein [Parafrankia colletiae]MCK9901886.1 glycosyltransferase [Frankia sp. Cpl3]OHV36539.1 hypothetical protein CC117_17855 [Parafrankia colletiae]
MPELTVVIPAWGSYVDRLPEALASVAAQDVPVETVVVADSADALHAVAVADSAGSPAVPPAVAGGDSAIRFVGTGGQTSVGETRNIGLAVVTTRFVMFWDADDLLAPGALRALLDVARTAPGAVAVYGRILRRDTGARYDFPPAWAGRVARYRTVFAVLNTVRLLYPVVGSVLRTEVVRDAGGFPDHPSGEDWALGVSLAFRGEVREVPVDCRVYRVSSDSLSGRQSNAGAVWARRRRVLRHLTGDPGVPRWVARAAPLIMVAQAVDVRLFRAVRSRRKRRAAPPAGVT